jgi:hypothetical protein
MAAAWDPILRALAVAEQMIDISIADVHKQGRESPPTENTDWWPARPTFAPSSIPMDYLCA